ncbi:PE-PGRS family protein [Streptomyces lancefieldiae]|uniref:PE-PGRS family protein n=1 Tax=Streptomyces lancefieldiae TaxID=3075520 RepID=A0ABU3ATQ8_9ACTN|nr:PE-PGRS family protein [Streptomyces sp. DSM 40712]MDT0613572.1 PE-PGRS family protein [Streptomyces sp. DSM 40712]
MRNANPDDLDQLAKLLDGRGGLQDKVDEAFSRASRLGVSSKLTALKPLRSWVTDTAPDLRKRAVFARLESGDPQAGLLWAGFSAKEIEKLKGEGLGPDVLLLANSVAASDDPHAYDFKRQPNESLADWVERLEAHAITRIPGLQPHEETVASMIGLYGDWASVTAATAVVTIQGTSLTKVLLGNSLKAGALRTWKTRLGVVLRGSNNGLIRSAGNGLIKWTPKIRSLSAPGSWLPGQLGSLFNRSTAYQNLARVPLTSGLRGDLLGQGYNWVRSAPLMNTLRANGAIDFLVGSDKVAQMYGGFTHSGQAVARAGNASLVKIFTKAANSQRFANSVAEVLPNAARGSGALRTGLVTAAKGAGFLRGAGIVGGVVSTGFSTANVISQGNPVDAFKRNGAGYVADVAEVGFNASLTAAMVAPNPVTIGLAVGTGLVYGGAKVVEHWDDIKKGAGKATDWVGDKVGDLGKSVAKSKANPMNWF